MNKAVFNQDHILFDQTSTTQEEAFKSIAKFAYESGFVSDEQLYFEGLKAREQEATTGFKDHIAIPHCKSSVNKKPGLFLIKFEQAIPWNALDQKPVKVAFGLTIPEEGATEHLKLLSLIARKLIDQDFRAGVLEQDDPAVLAEIINQIDFK
ncbi:PTS sugar transporter subunit IIA [Enterococcus hulanensis]|uniref:Fructose PTS transporter subunit IIA n=1 Tax=Enterococcus hulanensis TaxID=2559929 RepID=A0ABU3EVC2_9ENTE|nr:MULTISPECIES: fructose PTS transporter subunit IIA [Enterococcus]MBO0410630.1 PTS sugar transporter subunit IIA [Enterococcus hulanensis]MBO0456371.1 PTS sugar transporter subunit IIA [Enterococcus hulanensis]MBX8937729.1 PTS transporter subunit EIIA [Enterococcus gilvus]MDT2598799.1 fructose PTS transporter subunit IIA [Enterococcus hulanensis]MDT2607697.1 fructose PTS transporter subunit IIA [Enterococcus hulanensis]